MSDPTQFPSQPPQSNEGAPPLTGDGSQFDARLDHSDSDRLLAFEQSRVPSGGRILGVAAGVTVGLLAGFVGGFLVGQRTQVDAPRSAAEPLRVEQRAEAAPAPVLQPQTYTDSPVTETAPVTPAEVGQALSGLPGGPDRVRPTTVRPTTVRLTTATSAQPGALQIASRPSGAQVFVDDRRVGTTPMTLPAVTAGAHRVRIELPGFRPWATSVDVGSAERVRVGASLER